MLTKEETLGSMWVWGWDYELCYKIRDPTVAPCSTFVPLPKDAVREYLVLTEKFVGQKSLLLLLVLEM